MKYRFPSISLAKMEKPDSARGSRKVEGESLELSHPVGGKLTGQQQLGNSLPVTL